uniref:tricarballylate/proton symporter TcuC n=1 Tax=Burkholderia sp. BCC1638 TaxID=2681391 RepID=UPI0015886589
ATHTSVQSESKVKTVFRVVSGNFLEMYDFMVYGYYASAIAKTYFPSGDAFASLMLALSVFGAGFLIRPVGAIVLGAYIDHHGRRKGLILTLGLMALGTLAVATVPGYSTIGMLAPILVLLGRLLQGFSAGVELGGVSVYLSEIATKGNRGFYCSWQSASQQVAVVFAASLGVLLNSVVPAQEMTSRGWRVPFVIGCLIVPFLFYIRRTLQESDEFVARKHHPGIGEITRAIFANFGLILAGMGLVIMTTTSFYLITAYTPTFGKVVLKMSSFDALLVTACVGISNFVWLPISGAVSDRFGRRPVMLAFTLLTVFTAYPAMQWLVAGPSFGKLLAVA